MSAIFSVTCQSITIYNLTWPSHAYTVFMERARRTQSPNLTNSWLQIIDFNSGDWSWSQFCRDSNLMLLCFARSMSQTTPASLSFSLVNTAAITFSCWPFHTFHSHLASLSIQLCRCVCVWGRGGVRACVSMFTHKCCLTTAIYQRESWSHSSCRVQVNS